MRVFWNPLKRHNLILGKGGEENHSDGTENFFNDIMEENLRNLEKNIPVQA